jgi:hypothetical protein
MDRALPDTLKGIFHDLVAARTCVINIGQEVDGPHGRVGEHEYRIDEMIVVKSRRDVTAIHQFASFEGAAVKAVTSQFNALVPEELIVVVHVVTPSRAPPWGAKMTKPIAVTPSYRKNCPKYPVEGEGRCEWIGRLAACAQEAAAHALSIAKPVGAGDYPA